jgi:hypothetical protein
MPSTRIPTAKLKQALSETLVENPELLRSVVTDVLEDLGLAEAIRRGRKTKSVARAEILQVLRKKK